MFKALEDRIILKVDKQQENKTSSGLFLISNDSEDNTAVVVEVGPGRVLPNGIRLEPDVKVGDRVAYTKFATQELEHNGEDYLVIFSKDILAVIGE